MVFREDFPKENIISTRHGDLYKLDQRDPGTGHSTQQGVIGFYEGTLLCSNEIDTALSALARLANGNDAYDLREALAEPFNQLGGEGWLAYGVIDGEFLKSRDFGQRLSQDDIRFEIEKIAVAIDFQSSDEAILNVHSEWSSEDNALIAYDNIENLKTFWIEKADQKGLYLEVENLLDGNRHNIEIQISNLKNAVTVFFRRIEGFH